MRLTVVIPAFNEAAALGETLAAALAGAPSSLEALELLVVDDGSTDGTREIVRSFSTRDPRVRCIVHAKNGGKGRAVRTGIAEARMDWILLLDADHQIRIDEVGQVLRNGPGADVILGYRMARSDSAVRWVITVTFKAAVAALLGVHVRDVNCPFKLLRRDVAQALPLRCDGFVIDAEILLRLRQRGARCREVGVVWHPRTRGESTIGLRHLPELARELGGLVWERLTCRRGRLAGP